MELEFNEFHHPCLEIMFFLLLAHNLSVLFSPALVLAGAATGAAETVTGTPLFLLPAVRLEVPASVCVC